MNALSKIDASKVAARTVGVFVQGLERGRGAVIDHFHPLKVCDSWSIVSKLWDAEP